MKRLVKLVFGFVLALVLLAGPPVALAQAETNVRELASRYVEHYSRAYGVPSELVYAIIEVESNWLPTAVSPKGAAGLMQLMPATAARFGVRDRFDIEGNIRGGVAYLAWLMRQFQGDLRLVVAAYYAGESPILARGLAYSSPQVFRYVSRVAELYRAKRAETLAQQARRLSAVE